MKTTNDWKFDSNETSIDRSMTPTLIHFLLYLSLFNLFIMVAAPLCRLYLDINGLITFRVMLFAMLTGLFFAIVTLFVVIFSMIKGTTLNGKYCLVIMLLGFFPFVVAVLSIGIDSLRRPLIHDISTDTTNPPNFQEVRNLRTPEHNSPEYIGSTLAGIQQNAYPQIKPVITSLNRADALVEATQVVKDLQWEFINIDYDNGIIEAYDTSQLFGFVDDIIIRVREENQGARIDIRSASRVGKGDLGKNAERIKQFINTFRD
ncbi:MAG: hypothetical protein ACI9XC_000952 [Gammaproteobacteria bacterium]|jgi:uncharacterized protein (DUF1499 family)